MRIGELAERVGVTTKAIRYYERLGLLAPRRLANGYRSYDTKAMSASSSRSVTSVAAASHPVGPLRS
jgi:predicted site-specific integrase-resolvase